VFADFVNTKIESANKVIFILFADFSKSVKLAPLSLKKKGASQGNQPLDMPEDTYQSHFLALMFDNLVKSPSMFGVQ